MSEPIFTRQQFLGGFISPASPSEQTSEDCPICKENFDATSDARCPVTFSDKDSCKHIFCRHCITTWLAQERVNTCALCRRELFLLDEYDAYDDELDAYFDEVDEVDDWYNRLVYGEEEDDDDDGYFSDSDVDDNDNIRFVQDTDLETSNGSIDATARESPFPAEEIDRLLEDAWYKTWWMMSAYRHHVWVSYEGARRPPLPREMQAQAEQFEERLSQNNTEYVYSDSHNYILCPSANLLFLSFTSPTSLMSRCHGEHNFAASFSRARRAALEDLLEDIMRVLKQHIYSTHGAGDVPAFECMKEHWWTDRLRLILSLYSH